MAQAKYYVMLIVVAMIWGATPACGKILSTSLSPLLITGVRFACISVVLFIWIFISGQQRDLKMDKRTLGLMAAMGFVGITIHNGLLFTGLHFTTATNAALIESIGPTVTTVLAFIFAAGLNYLGCLAILFRHKARWSAPGELGAYVLVVCIMGILDYVLTYGFVALGLSPVASKTFSTIIGFVGNFLFRKYLVF